jgi:S1-C subfamily serine protease
MKRLLLSVFLISFIIGGHQVGAAQDPADILQAMVKVRSTVPGDALTARALGTEREGNGVVIDSNGLVLTIGYLILEAETIEVIDADDNRVPASFVGYDHGTGFGLLKTVKSLKVTPIELGESSKINQGDPVLIVGHGGTEAVQGGRVLSRGEFTGYWEYLLENAIYAAPPHPGFGGAALIGRGGRLVGIGSIFTQLAVSGVGTVACNMFVPIDLLKPILNDLKTFGRSSKPPRPWLGVHLDETHGRVIVIRVSKGGPAERAGMKPGDIILTVDKKAVQGLADCYRKIWAVGKAGVEVPFSVLQGTQIREIKIRSADRHKHLRLKPGRGRKNVVLTF